MSGEIPYNEDTEWGLAALITPMSFRFSPPLSIRFADSTGIPNGHVQIHRMNGQPHFLQRL